MRNLTCLQATDHMNQHKELETFVIQIRGNPWLLDHMSVRAGGSGGALLCKMKSRVTLTHSQIGGLDNDYWQAVDGLSLVDDADVDVQRKGRKDREKGHGVRREGSGLAEAVGRKGQENDKRVGGGFRIHPENARVSGRHGVQYCMWHNA